MIVSQIPRPLEYITTVPGYDNSHTGKPHSQNGTEISLELSSKSRSRGAKPMQGDTTQ